MNAEEIVKLIKNKAVSDEDVSIAIKEFTADKYNKKGEIIPVSTDELQIIEDLGLLTQEIRPNVIEKLRQEFWKVHYENCPVCQKMKADQEPE